MSVFSIPAFFIVLREVLEACLVVGIVLAYLKKTGATQYNKWVWFGAGAGVGISAAIGVAFAVVFFTTGDQLFSGSAEKIFEGVTFLIAAGLLTWMIIWMMVMGKNLRQEMEDKIERIVEDENKKTRGRQLSIFFMVFVQVLREGIETVVFLIGSANADDVGGWRAIPIPGVLAIIVGLVGSYLVFRGLVQLDILRVFYISSFILMAFAAGLTSHAFHELQEVDWFGPWKPSEERDWYNAVMWSTKGCCHDKENQFFAMLRALFGYQDTPTFVEWGTYFGYWLIVVAIFAAVNWKYIRAARSRTMSLAQKLACSSLIISFVGFVYAVMNVTWIGVTTMTLAFVLSIITLFAVFDSLMKLMKPLMAARRMIMIGLAAAWAVLMAFMFVLHIVEMECEGSEECELAMFFYFGLIFNGEFNETGRQEKSWPAIGALSVSIVATVYFFGALAFTLLLAAWNIDGQGNVIGDDAVVIERDEGDVIEEVGAESAVQTA